MHTTVPVIDIAPFDPRAEPARPLERDAVVRAVDAACTDIGFFTIAGHGVPAALVDRMLATSRAFFDLPADEKQRVARPRPEQSRGYLALGAENLSYSRGDASTTDLKEFFAIGPIDVPDEAYYRRPEAYPSFAPNLWPERPAVLRAVWTEYYRTMEGLAAHLMRIFALALHLPENFFATRPTATSAASGPTTIPSRSIRPRRARSGRGRIPTTGPSPSCCPRTCPGCRC